MKRVVTFGEIMMRLNPPGYQRFQQASSFEISFAGGEANVAVSLAQYGVDASFVTKLPGNDLAKCAVNELRRFGVDTRSIVYGGERLGVYYVEKGASQRASKVLYDRAHSSIAEASPDDFDWDSIFDGVDWFHFTGITPALGPNLPSICEQACIAAKEHGAVISCDLNYRNKLWSREDARKVMSRLAGYFDVCIANEEDASDVFGISAKDTDLSKGKLDKESYIDVARQIHERFGCPRVAITLRTSISASVNKWSGMLYEDDTAYIAPEYTMQIVDRVGGGDSFGAGLIYALLNDYEGQKAIDFAVAASCLKHSIEHDFNLVSVAEVENLAGGNASGRVQR